MSGRLAHEKDEPWRDPKATPITIEPGADQNEDVSGDLLDSDVGAAEWAKLLPPHREGQLVYVKDDTSDHKQRW